MQRYSSVLFSSKNTPWCCWMTWKLWKIVLCCPALLNIILRVNRAIWSSYTYVAQGFYMNTALGESRRCKSTFGPVQVQCTSVIIAQCAVPFIFPDDAPNIQKPLPHLMDAQTLLLWKEHSHASTHKRLSHQSCIDYLRKLLSLSLGC